MASVLVHKNTTMQYSIVQYVVLFGVLNDKFGLGLVLAYLLHCVSKKGPRHYRL